MEIGIGHVTDDGMFGRQPMAKIRPPVGHGGRVSHTLLTIANFLQVLLWGGHQALLHQSL